jgi:hypothetical protein
MNRAPFSSTFVAEPSSKACQDSFLVARIAIEIVEALFQRAVDVHRLLETRQRVTFLCERI